MKLVSPQQLQDAARMMCLDGREPETTKDWMLCANFWAANIVKENNALMCVVIGKILGCPLSESDIEEVSAFQVKDREKEGKE